MPTKDPHIAVIDAQEELHQIKQRVRNAIALVQKHARAGEPLDADQQMLIKAIRQTAIDATRRVQDQLYNELESHARQSRELNT